MLVVEQLRNPIHDENTRSTEERAVEGLAQKNS